MENTVLFLQNLFFSELVEKLYQYGITKTYHEGDIILDENSSIRSFLL
jgi:CRP/FNR family transcriptional regulator